MSALIRVYKDPFDPTTVETHRWAGPYYEWLEETYGGSPGPHLTRFNGAPLDVADYDIALRGGDTIDLLIQPGADWAVVGKAIFSAIIAYAINYIANAVFGSDPPSAQRERPSRDQAARVSALGIPTNTAKIGEVIPVVYGRNLWTPDLASEPYSRFEGNDQYIRGILCLGHGTFDIHDVKIANTSFSALGSDASYTEWTPTAHGGTLGTIEAVNDKYYEDVTTSADVGTHDLQDGDDGLEVGPYVACPRNKTARRIEVDVELPQGLYEVDKGTGNSQTEDVRVQTRIWEIDDSDNIVGLVAAYTEEMTENSIEHKRYTYAYDIDPPKRVAVEMIRTDDPKGDPAEGVDLAYWTGLRAVHPVSGSAYGNVTLLFYQLKATNGINGNAANQIRVDATRKLNGTATSNPAIIFRDAYTDTTYGGRRPLTELDTDALSAWESDVSSHNGFNFIFDSRRSLWDALSAIALTTNRYPTPIGAEITVAEDDTKSSVSMAFTSSMISNVAYVAQFDRADSNDGYEVVYTNPTTFGDAYVYSPSTTSDPKSVKLEGCTDTATAQAFADRLQAKKQYRREYVTFTTELEGHLLAVGELISIDHPVFSGNCVVQSVNVRDDFVTEVTAWRYDSRQYA
jgi:hypothetical protein